LLPFHPITRWPRQHSILIPIICEGCSI